MLSAVVLAVTFVGVHGHDAKQVDRQLGALLHHDAGVEASKIASRDRAALLGHDRRAAGIVRALDTAGVIAAGLSDDRTGTTLRIVVYRGDGDLAQVLDTPLDAHALGPDDLEVLRSNLIPAVEALEAAAAAASPPPEVADPFAEPAAAPDAQSEIEMAPDPVAPGEQAAPTGAVAEADAVAAADDAEADEFAATADDANAAATDDATDATDAVPDDDDDEPPPHLGLEAAIGAGILSRDFSAGPASIAGYGASAVPTIRFSAAATPVPRLALHVLAERTLAMTTTIGRDAAPTAVTRWQAAAAYVVLDRTLRVSVIAGLGWRSFSIESTDPMRSPDSHYRHLIAGLEVARTIGRLSVNGTAQLLPVIGGDQPTATAFGAARRWGIDVGIAAVVHLGRLYTELTADYQRFQWSWPAAGERSMGGATDAFPSLAIAVGARY